MYGLVNKALEGLIKDLKGEAVWSQICSKVGLEDTHFLSHESYPDKFTYDLVGAASCELGWEVEKLLQEFGKYWILETARKGYGRMLEAGGGTLREFLSNLPYFHSRVSMFFPDLEPPSFECEEIVGNGLKLHYRSHREGLTEFVRGILEGLAIMFETKVKIELVESRSEGCDHDVFTVIWVGEVSGEVTDNRMIDQP
jgi:hypothetical protein